MHFKIKALGWDMVKEMLSLPTDPVERESLLEKLHFLKVKEAEFTAPQTQTNGQDIRTMQGARR